MIQKDMRIHLIKCLLRTEQDITLDMFLFSGERGRRGAFEEREGAPACHSALSGSRSTCADFAEGS